MKINYLSYDDRLRQQSLTQQPESENMRRKISIVSNEKSSVSKDKFSGSNMRNESNNVAAINFGGKISKAIFKNKLFNELLEGFEKQTALAQNGVALIVAGCLRPATNIAMASDKDREDCVHAATHSISSGVVGFGVTCSVMKPFTDAVSKFKNNPAKYLKAEMADFYKVEALGPRKVQASKLFKSTCKMTEMIPEIVIGVPKAMLTIALIPPLLKYCFGIEKKKKDAVQQEMIKQEIKNDDVKELAKKDEKAAPNFEGVKKPRSFFKELQVRMRMARMYYNNTVVEGIADNYYGKMMQSPAMKWLGKATENLWIDAVELCSIVNSFIISTLYAFRTLQNKNLKEEKRRTLAVNDILTFLGSTALSLTANKSLANFWSKVTHNYAACQLNITPEELTQKINEANASKKYANVIRNAEDYSRDVIKDVKLNFRIKGMGIVKTLFVFGMVYRYIVPVFVMKPANKMGEKLNAHIRAKEEKKLAQMNKEIEAKKEAEAKAMALKDVKKLDLDDIDDIDDIDEIDDIEDLEDLQETAYKIGYEAGRKQVA